MSENIRLEKANIQSAANAFSPFSYTMAVPRRDSLQASLPQPLQCDLHAARPLSLQITMAAAQRQTSQTTSMQHLQGDLHAAQTLVLQITMAPVHRHTSQTSFSQHLQCDSEPARTNTMEITMAVVLVGVSTRTKIIYPLSLPPRSNAIFFALVALPGISTWPERGIRACKGQGQRLPTYRGCCSTALCGLGLGSTTTP